jgi:hypothetical protein
MSMNEYITNFTQLSCCAPHEVDTDEEKLENCRGPMERKLKMVGQH